MEVREKHIGKTAGGHIVNGAVGNGGDTVNKLDELRNNSASLTTASLYISLKANYADDK
jgi:hypothetical protein